MVFRRVEDGDVYWEGLVIGRADEPLQFDLHLSVERSFRPTGGDPYSAACNQTSRFNVPCLGPGRSYRLPGPVSACPVETRFAFVDADASDVVDCN